MRSRCSGVTSLAELAAASAAARCCTSLTKARMSAEVSCRASGLILVRASQLHAKISLSTLSRIASRCCSGALRCVRYNETDRGTLDCLGFDETAAFYEHAAALHGAIAALETELRLDTGQAILIDNHRVMHGRRAFRGHRNLLGCYLPADDWQSLLRVARRERGEWEP